MVKVRAITVESDLLAERTRLQAKGWTLIGSYAFWYPFIGLAWLGMICAPPVCLAFGLSGLGLLTPRESSPYFGWSWWVGVAMCAYVACMFVFLCIRLARGIIYRKLKVEWLMFAAGYVLAGFMLWGVL